MNHAEGSFNRSLSPEEVDSTGILSAHVRLKGNRCPTGAAACEGKSAGLLDFQRETCFDILMARVSGRGRWSGDKYCLPPCATAGQEGEPSGSVCLAECRHHLAGCWAGRGKREGKL